MFDVGLLPNADMTLKLASGQGESWLAGFKWQVGSSFPCSQQVRPNDRVTECAGNACALFRLSPMAGSPFALIAAIPLTLAEHSAVVASTTLSRLPNGRLAPEVAV